MTRTTANQIAASIISTGALNCLDNDCENLAEHVAAGFDDWRCRDIRSGTDSAERDEFRYSVQQALNKLGFNG